MGAITIAELTVELKSMIPHMETVEGDGDETYRSIYLGSFLSLDPCGKYHHVLSPNGVTEDCEEYWENLEKAATELGGWIQSGEGDPLDTFFCLPGLVEGDEDPDINF